MWAELQGGITLQERERRILAYSLFLFLSVKVYMELLRCTSRWLPVALWQISGVDFIQIWMWPGNLVQFGSLRKREWSLGVSEGI